MQIAALARIDCEGDSYIVPSVTNPRPTKYRVTMDGLFPKCTCPDFEIRGCRCKHIYAVEYFIQRETSVAVEADGSTTVTDKVTITRTRKTYSQDWPNYNAAQQNEKREFQTLLAELCKGIPELPVPQRKGPQGRKPLPPTDALFCAVFKVYRTMSARRFTSDPCDAQAKGYVNRVPHFQHRAELLGDAGTVPDPARPDRTGKPAAESHRRNLRDRLHRVLLLPVRPLV
jgi:hypothetical protein